MKMAQSRTMYIVEYISAGKWECLALDNLYIMVESFIGLAFTNWSKIINIKNDDFFKVWWKRDVMYGNSWEYGSLLL